MRRRWCLIQHIASIQWLRWPKGLLPSNRVWVLVLICVPPARLGRGTLSLRVLRLIALAVSNLLIIILSVILCFNIIFTLWNVLQSVLLPESAMWYHLATPKYVWLTVSAGSTMKPCEHKPKKTQTTLPFKKTFYCHVLWLPCYYHNKEE